MSKKAFAKIAAGLTEAVGYSQGWNAAIERAALEAEGAFGGMAQTYASENADRYRAQDEACALIASRIRALRNG